MTRRWRSIAGLLEGAPQAADLHLSIAHSLKTLGRRQESIDAYRAAAAVRPDFGDTYWSLANLKTYRFTADELGRMQAAESAPATDLVDRYHLCFALGKAFEDQGDFARSFRYYERGNALKRSESRYRPEIIEANTQRQSLVCTRELFGRHRGSGAPSDAPIFIVGLPRSGSTLLEQILASHSGVEGTQELADVPRIVHELQGRDPDLNDPRYPGVLATLAPSDFARLGEKYLRDTLAYRVGKPRFIDKMPNNFRHLGLIHLMLPNARIIDARREPMACCFSNLKQLFARGQEFTYSIEDIARYYRTYLDLMQHWDEVLPGRSCGCPRGRGRRSRGQRPAAARFLRPSVRTRVHRLPQDRAEHPHGEFRAGPPADLSRGARPVEALRALAGGAQGCPGRCVDSLPLRRRRP